MRYLSLIVAIVLFSLPANAAHKTRSKKKTNSQTAYEKNLKGVLESKIPAVFNDIPLSEVCKKITATSRFKKVSVGRGVDETHLIKMDVLFMSTGEVLGWVAVLTGPDIRAVIENDWEVVIQLVENPKDERWNGRLIEEPKREIEGAPAKEEPAKEEAAKEEPAKKKGSSKTKEPKSEGGYSYGR